MGYDDGGEFVVESANQRGGSFDIVIVAQYEIVGNVQFAVAAGELDDAAMVRLAKDQDLVSPRHSTCCCQRHQIGFCSRVAETDLVKRRVPLA